jgi:nuclear pore complex protein Nup133
MFSGEHVVQLVNAESAGFMLVFSSGRIAYMSVRDGHGRPAISVHFLRNGLANSGGGFFGSIRHALSASSARGDIAAVHANNSSKVGERHVIAATTKGKLHAWRIHRGGHHDVVAEVDVREAIISATQEADSSSRNLSPDTFELIDFTFIPRGLEMKYRDVTRFSQAISSEDDSLQHLLFLVSFSNKRQSRYSLVEGVISGGDFEVGMVRPLTSYAGPIRTAATEHPKLYLPRPALVAFVVFDRAVVLASLALPPDSPDSQLQEDSHIVPATFEDVIDIQNEDTVEIVGSGIEEPSGASPALEETRVHRYKTKNPTTVLLVRGVGVIRVALGDIDRFMSEKPPKVTAKSKLEQAVFFGIKEQNPLVFEGRRELQFSSKEIGDAAVELSLEIVSSKTPYITNLPASLESNMRNRINYLQKLISHLNALKVDLDQRTRWALLWNAEKMSVATWIWTKHEEFLADRPVGDKKSIASETSVYIHENQKKEPNPAVGEVDPVRHWFINDVWRLDIFVAWGYQIIKYHYQERLSDTAGLNRLLYEAVTMSTGAMEEAHTFRRQHSSEYGVKKSSSKDGVPEPWTATHFITNNLKRLVEFCYQWLDEYYLSDQDGPLDVPLLGSVRDQLPRLTEQFLTSLSEYSDWASTSPDEQIQEYGKICKTSLDTDSKEKVLRLKKYGLWDQAIQLAEKNKTFETMARLVVEQIQAIRQQASTRGISSSKAEEQLALASVKEQQMGDYFDQYGHEFAFPAYGVLLETSGIQAVLDFPCDRNGFATQFLRTKPELAKISWINDVEREKDIDHAAETLLDLGLSREQQVWNKKIELSLGKLALMAEEAEPSIKDGSVSQSDLEAKKGDSLDKVDRELNIIKIQDALYSLILPSIMDAIDEPAEVDLALRAHAGLISQKVFSNIFEDSLIRLIKHEALDVLSLIDVLTLGYFTPDHFDAIGDQFYLALQVAEFGLKGHERVLAQRLIWRRCYIRDDWKRVNETNEKSDYDQLETVGQTCAYRTLFACIDEREFTNRRWTIYF